MKQFVFIITLFLLAACASQKGIQGTDKSPIVEEDSVSYELVIVEPGFETWYQMNRNPTLDHSQQYYEYWNRIYVDAWNSASFWQHDKRLLGSYINYDSQIDYGMELNRKLFYYFQYVEQVLKIPIIANGPSVI